MRHILPFHHSTQSCPDSNRRVVSLEMAGADPCKRAEFVKETGRRASQLYGLVSTLKLECLNLTYPTNLVNEIHLGKAVYPVPYVQLVLSVYHKMGFVTIRISDIRDPADAVQPSPLRRKHQAVEQDQENPGTRKEDVRPVDHTGRKRDHVRLFRPLGEQHPHPGHNDISQKEHRPKNMKRLMPSDSLFYSNETAQPTAYGISPQLVVRPLRGNRLVQPVDQLGQ